MADNCNEWTTEPKGVSVREEWILLGFGRSDYCRVFFKVADGLKIKVANAIFFTIVRHFKVADILWQVFKKWRKKY